VRALTTVLAAALLGAALPAMTGQPPCLPAGGGGSVQPPAFVRNHSGQTSWFASPIVADLDGDGSNELVVATFDHGLDVFTVPGSGTNCVLWPTARGGPLRTGSANAPWLRPPLFSDGFESGDSSAWSTTVP